MCQPLLREGELFGDFESLADLDEIAGDSVGSAKGADGDSLVAPNFGEGVAFADGVGDDLRLRLGLRRGGFWLGGSGLWGGDGEGGLLLDFCNFALGRILLLGDVFGDVVFSSFLAGGGGPVPFFRLVYPVFDVVPTVVKGAGDGVCGGRGGGAALGE